MQESNFFPEIHRRTSAWFLNSIQCGKCEKVCPQHLPIRELLADVVKTFETEVKK